jgi:alpha-tubulin suppressor-like RCC1 family protein
LAFAVLVAATGCRSILGFEDVVATATDSGGDDDAAIDGSDDAIIDGPKGSGALRVAAGGNHTCVVDGDGNVKCWGRGTNGALGYGDSQDVGDNEAPSTVGFVTVGMTVTEISAGNNHTCALGGGKVRCWGNNNDFQLGYPAFAGTSIGDNETPSSAGDVDVGGTVVEIAAGSSHTCARVNNGGVKCWGLGQSGRLGYGNTNAIGDNEFPENAGDLILPAPALAMQIAAGDSHTCALLSNGDVVCWGIGADGRLGYGNIDTIGDNEEPASAGVVQLGASAIQVVAGGLHSCALLVTKQVICWGEGAAGQLGYGNTDRVGDNETPVTAGTVSVGGDVEALSAGGAFTCALLVGGTVKCWGNAGAGQLGTGNTQAIGDNELPSSIGPIDLGGVATRIESGAQHTCAVLDTGAVRCWGVGGRGRLGHGNQDTIGDTETPASAGDVPFR